MRLTKKIMYLAITSLPLVMSSCPEDDCPNAYVVKIKKDCSGKVLVEKMYKYDYSGTFSNDERVDSFYSYIREDDLERITGNYYKLDHFSREFSNIMCTSINYEDWNDSLMKSISDYVIDTDPFDEVYAYYEDYSKHALMRIINQNKLKDFERLK